MRILGSNSGQFWSQIRGTDQHRYMRILFTWGARTSYPDEPGWESPPEVKIVAGGSS